SLQKETVDGFANTFGAITATRSKYKTGSHVDMDGWGFLVGAGTTKNWTNGQKTAYGLFFEYGKGDFDTYNNDIHGEGDSNNKGVGVIARHTLKNNTYIDGAVRYGKQETEWSESEIGGYDTDSRYYGVALGLGHIYPLGKNEIDIYGRYSFGHTGACDAKVKDSDYHFDSVKSHRIRLGAKYNFVQEKSNAKPYVGLAWEHEFNGESKATITGVGEAPAPSLKGHTGIMQAGCSWETGKWTLGAEANAYIGKRKGWGGMVNAFYNF
ncbi:MAG: autotransporter outer membrane beta-barrel domain-containing protein, partial [Acidaminococcaceae bacterium]|nr:autotransporter outer membrane beta-barrel domain-containing protein [Acidaminococcaceae bacterium]